MYMGHSSGCITVGQKVSLNKLKKTEIITSIVLNHNGMELEINYKKKTQKKNTNTWKLNNKGHRKNREK